MKSNSLKIIVIFFLALMKCDWNSGIAMQMSDSIQSIILQNVQTQYIVGHFTDKETSDTLRFQYSTDEGVEIKRIPSMENDWDSVIKWFCQDYQINSFIAYDSDTLFFESAYNLFCFFNIGDVNLDGVDEFAIVVNWLDYSNINSCKIYSICNHKFSLLKVFNIHEFAFMQRGTQDTSFTGIKDYLEKEDGVWIFHEYLSDNKENKEMTVLQLEKCNK